MILQKRIPKDFYKLFRTQNMQYYMQFLVALYVENRNAYLLLGLTEHECRGVISHMMEQMTIQWAVELEEDEEEPGFAGATPAGILNRLVKWSWLKRDFDDRLNRYVYSFPEYSQLYVELFERLQTEDDSRERESILSIYSALYTYYGDSEKNNGILNHAMVTCRNLSQLLTNMQDGIRSYFETLSKQKHVIGIQEVLIEEINNSDSKKYAILTTTDSFYRYKEAIKELLSKILMENDLQKSKFQKEKTTIEVDSISYTRIEKRLNLLEEAGSMVYQLEREFDMMEAKYKKLIEQKSTFAKRALARIRYILQEGSNQEDSLMQWIQLLNTHENQDEILEKTREKLYITSQYQLLSDESFRNRVNQPESEFQPEAVVSMVAETENRLEHYLPKPLYTKRELKEFKQKNQIDGKFVTTIDTVKTMEDLEKLLFVWQEATEMMDDTREITLGKTLINDKGMTFTELVVGKE